MKNANAKHSSSSGGEVIKLYHTNVSVKNYIKVNLGSEIHKSRLCFAHLEAR